VVALPKGQRSRETQRGYIVHEIEFEKKMVTLVKQPENITLQKRKYAFWYAENY